MGAQRREHHRREQAKRDAAAQVAAMEEQQRQFQEQLRVQRESMMAQTEAMREAMAPNINVGGTLGAQNVGIRTARSKRSTVRGLSKGLAQLRIPLNIGGAAGSGLNIG